MIKRIDITGINIELKADIKKYVRRKIGRLDRFVPRHARESLHAEVILKEANEKHGNKYECEIKVHVPDELLVVKDSTMNIFAAVDIVEQKLKNVMRKYKEQRTDHGRGILSRLRRRPSLASEDELAVE
ncbi:MAG TPA: ribosome-associated translation inhibitor RaiA [Candidatus Saccharimonadales bacterium]